MINIKYIYISMVLISIPILFAMFFMANLLDDARNERDEFRKQLELKDSELKDKERILERMFAGYCDGACIESDKTCDVAWSSSEEKSSKIMTGVAPVGCAERDAIIWVKPLTRRKWQFKCIMSK